MTKIKNTKKGMAKKTLSISLAVAMLATSNVPVWAAEFTDGTDAAFTSEAPAEVVDEAPVVDEEETPVASDVTEAGDLILDELHVDKTATFATGKVNVSGKIKYKKDGDIKELTNYKFGWRVKGSEQNIFTDEVGIAGDPEEKKSPDKMSITPDFAKTQATWNQGDVVDWSKYVGKVLELVVFNNEADDEIKINPTVVGETVIEKCDMTGAKLNLNTISIIYNGKAYKYADVEGIDTNVVGLNKDPQNSALINVSTDDAPGNATKWMADDVLKYFDVASNTVVNAGEKLVVKATAKADSPYKGTIYADALEVQKKQYQYGDLTVTVDAGISYPYTGNAVDVDSAKVHLKESDALSGKELTGIVKSARTNTEKVGKQQVYALLDTTLLTNFNFGTNVEEWALLTPDAVDANKVEITKRDLSENGTSLSIKHGRVPLTTSVSQFVNDGHLVMKDKDGTALNLNWNNDFELSILDPDNHTVKDNGNFTKTGTYKVTVFAKEGTDNCYDGQTFEFEVASNVIGDITYSNDYTPYYTGEEIRPSKTDLGKLTIKNVDGKEEPIQDDQYDIIGYSNNTNASTYYKDGTVKTYGYVQIKVKGASSYAGQTFDVPFEIKPLTVSEGSVTVPTTVTYNQGYGAASDYNVQLIVTAKDETGKIVKGLSTDDYTVKYEYVDKNSVVADAKNELHDRIKATITVKNTNFMGEKGQVISVEMASKKKQTEIVEKAITSDMIKFNPETYTYTGGNIAPTFVVMDGALVLYDKAEYGDKGEYEVVSITNNKDVGTGTVTVKGVTGKYSGKASADFTITAANTADVKVEFTDADECLYTGRQVRPRTFKATLNGNNVTDQFEIVGYGENISGKGTVELKPVDGNKNFTGNNITAEFNIVKEIVTGDLHAYNANGEDVTTKYEFTENTTTVPTNYFDFDGTAKEFASALLKNLQKDADGNGTADGTTKATADDFEIKYVDNVSGKKGFKSGKDHYNIAYVYVVAKDGSGYVGTKEFTTADGTTIKGVVDYVPFLLKNVKFVKENVSIKNGTYAGGLPVKPEVLVQINGNTLVEGKDYTLKLVDSKNQPVTPIDVTDGKIYKAIVTGINGYEGSEVKELAWGVDKKDIADCDVKVVNGVAYVMNGYIPVPTTEYTVKENDDKTYTVTANKDSKNYTGSKTVVAEGQKPTDKPETPMIEKVNVVGNKATVILSGETEGAVGYDYVISTDKDCINNKDYDKVNKNILNTTTDFTYVGQDVYYAYCHAWKRGEDGKKIFSDWSNAYPFVVSAITPSQPAITSVKVKGSTVTVTYTKSSNTDGYDVVLGSKVATVAGEKRPVEYGTLVKKNIKGNTVTATFKNVKKGTYYAGLHAFNRTSEDGKKVFSPWSNVKKVTVK